jgi:hypothetical protein
MKSLTYQHAHELADFTLHLQEVPGPTLRDTAEQHADHYTYRIEDLLAP